MSFLKSLFDPTGFPPRWYCGQWSSELGWLHILSDLAIFGAYFAIPCILGFFLIRRKDLPFRMIFLLFGAFILFCGTTHLMEAVIFWWPGYRLAGVIKAATAIVSWATIVALIRVAPAALAMRSPESFEREIAQRTRELRESNDHLRKAEAQFRTLANSTPHLAWMTGPDGRVHWFNDRWHDFTGTDPEQMTTDSLRNFIEPGELPRVQEKFRACIASGQPWEDTFPIRRHDGKYRWHLSRALPVENSEGRIVCWLGTNTDITDQRELQEELRLTAARLSEADRRKNEFLATLSHELRNPLTPIRMGLELMKRAKDDPSVVEDTRETMERQTQQLIRLVDDLLDVSRITRGKLELRTCEVDLRDVIRSAVEASRPLIDEGGHSLAVHLPDDAVRLNADPHRLAQIVSNLLNNASKYTPDGGSIELSARLEGDEAVISVKDSGIGIPPEMKARIFDMFAQIDRPVEKASRGLGIGLTLVKSLVEMHGGRIDVDSAGPDRGSEFTVRLPIRSAIVASSASESLAPAATATPFNKWRVMIVDDNRDAVDVLNRVIQILGHETCVAYDGLEAVEQAETFRPDVILLDLGMPRMTGFEAARHIRRQPWAKDVTIVALTGWGKEEDKQRTQAAGFDQHLVKPVQPAELQAVFASRKPAAS